MRLIDADVMCDDLNTVNPKYKTMIDWCIRVIKAQPTVEAELVRHGHWIVRTEEVDGSYFTGCRCSNCNYWKADGIWNYCPNCGAKMENGNDSN